MNKFSLRKKFKNTNGITLIALVVTIIILLILAGISIAMLTGNNGVLTQAKSAKENTKIGEMQEKVKLAAQAALTASLGNGIEKEKFQEELNNMFTQGEQVSLDYDETNKKYIVSVDKYEVEVSNMGAVGDVEEATIQAKSRVTYKNTEQKAGENIAKVVDKNVPIPTNFYYVGGTKDTGVVISDSSEDENKGVDSDLKGNQFVWVPVNQNQKLQIDITSKDDISSISLKDPWGEEKLTESNVGKTYNKKDQEPTINGTYTLTITTTTGKTKTIKQSVHSLYKQDFWIDETLDENAKSKNMSLEEYAKSENYNTVDEMITDYTNYYKPYTDNDTNQESVNTYGGFYIARYEAGKENKDDSSSSYTVVSKKNAIVYNDVSSTEPVTKAESMYPGKSKLISCAGWDRTVNWLIETKAKTQNEILINSNTWGNYADSIEPATKGNYKKLFTQNTGSNENWKANNIYDLAGNYLDFVDGTYTGYNTQIARGGCSGNFYCSVSAYDPGLGYPDGSFWNFSFRPALYL